MSIDANFTFNIPTDADFPDDVTIERDIGETRVYAHPDIISEIEKDNQRLQARVDEFEKILDVIKAIYHRASMAEGGYLQMTVNEYFTLGRMLYSDDEALEGEVK